MNVSRRTFLKWSVRAAAASIVGSGVYAGYIEPHRVRVTRLAVAVPQLPAAWRGLRVAHLTDLHRGAVVSRAYLAECIAAANAAPPDLIALTGDYLTDHGDGQQQVRAYVRDVAECVAQARARYGVFASLGNHDHWFDAEYVTDALREAGATVLRNENRSVTVNGAALPVVGLGDLWTEPPEFVRAFAGVGEGFALVLMHNPDSFHEWRQPGSQLILSGHTHGGQVNVPLFGPPVVPSRYGPLYAQGWFRRGDAQMYVSRGVGMISPAVRFNCAPELPVFELQPA